MHATRLLADWAPRPGLTPAEVESRRPRMACLGWRNPRVEEVDLPDPEPSASGVVLRVHACGVCGSDLHCVETGPEGYVVFSGPARFPCVLGHEFAGEVVAVGSAVRTLRPGDLVTAESMGTCGVCGPCRSGRPNQCANLEMVGFTSPGAFATFAVAEERQCWRLDGLAERLGDARKATEQGALVEPLACAYNALYVESGGVRPGGAVAVFGCGPIGLGAVALARAGGAAVVVAFDPMPERRAVAHAAGADEALDPMASSPGDEILRATRGSGIDLVIEAAGVASRTVPAVESALAPGGRVVLLGRTGERAMVGLDSLVSGAGGIVGSRGHSGSGCFPRVIALLERGRLPVDALVTCRLPLRDAAGALERGRSRRDAKILLVSD